jgi:hypothetical protein
MTSAVLLALAVAAGPPKLIYCHMDECSWSRLVSNRVVARRGREQLRAYVTIDGQSNHRGSEYPTHYSKRVHVAWEAKPVTTYVLCSRARPGIAFQDRWDRAAKGRWYAHYLDLFDLYGYNTSSAVIYAAACHGIDFNFGDAEKALRKLGYRPGTRSEQVDVRRPTDLLKR